MWRTLFWCGGTLITGPDCEGVWPRSVQKETTTMAHGGSKMAPLSRAISDRFSTFGACGFSTDRRCWSCAVNASAVRSYSISLRDRIHPGSHEVATHETSHTCAMRRSLVHGYVCCRSMSLESSNMIFAVRAMLMQCALVGDANACRFGAFRLTTRLPIRFVLPCKRCGSWGYDAVMACADRRRAVAPCNRLSRAEQEPVPGRLSGLIISAVCTEASALAGRADANQPRSDGVR